MSPLAPAKLLGQNNKGIIEVGKDADIVVFDGDFNLQNVILSGFQIDKLY